MINVLSGFAGQVQSAVTAASEAVEARAPEQLKPQVTQVADQFQQALSNPALLNQLGVPTPAALTPLDTPQKVKTAYAQSASRDLTDKKTLEKLNQELGDKGPVTAAEVNQVIQNTDVKALSEKDYATLKMATAVPGASRSNPATAMDADSRAALAEKGPENLARARNGNREPSADQIADAKKELERIDPGMFKKGAKDVIYVNEKHVGGHGDPRQTKVADHEYLHLLLGKKGVTGEEAQHELIGKFGWNQKPGPGGENRNWATPPGKGLPPD